MQKQKNISGTASTVPLAERMRPQSADTYLGQEKIFGEGSFLREAVRNGAIPSLLFWGPPGSGKTTLARILSRELSAEFIQLSAVESGKKDLTAVLDRAKANREQGKRTILFLDEIHRWNKAQQDALLPFVESGVLTLIGATTENPSFSVNAALLSRTRVLVLSALPPQAIEALLERAIHEDEFLIAAGIDVETGVTGFLAEAAGGDARQALSKLVHCGHRISRLCWQRKSCSDRTCSMTKMESGTTMSFPHCTNRCGAAMRTERFIGSAGCSRQGRILSISRAV